MGIGTDPAVVMEGVRASVAALDALDLEDASLASASACVGDGVDVLERRYEIRLERMELRSRLAAQLAAGQAQDAVDAIEFQQAMLAPNTSVQDCTFAEMSVVEEIAGVLTISSGAAGALVGQARRVCSLPPLFEALAAGAVSWQHARIVADETEGLTPAGAAGLVAHFFDPDAPNPARGAAPGELVPSRFRAKVRGWRERHHPETLEKRHAKGVSDRRMDYTPDRDGMGWISLHLPGDTACAIWNRSTATARGLQGPTEERTLTQLRADVAASLLLGAGLSTAAAGSTNHTDHTNPALGSGTTSTGGTSSTGGTEHASAATTGAGRDTAPVHATGMASTEGTGTDGAGTAGGLGKVPVPRAEVLVMVPVFSLLGLTDEPAVLDGFGPIPASMARRLVADGAESFYRVLVDPRDGAPLEIGRTRYRLPETIKKWIRMRDGKCTFPGCNNRTTDNDTDHLTAWEHGGTTGASNLGQLCPKHHRLKHARPWIPTPATTNEPPGWTSPTGRHYKPEQPDREPTQWPPATLPVNVDAGLNERGAPPRTSTSPEVTTTSTLPDPVWQLEEQQFQQLIAGMPAWPDPPPEEPQGNHLLDPDEFCCTDSLWDDFFAVPFRLPADPQADWQQLASHT
ncbi:HNH endonuclease signature motif containing protein [Pseudarthrobacter sp. YAF2]|uniref:HNH endonuclease signature motif containing protein n=1 Tax=Pseudarthrobacter sp. YAF2 TaxID=3233078 RepID=UPI003F9549C1